jgi:hypothetical protein
LPVNNTTKYAIGCSGAIAIAVAAVVLLSAVTIINFGPSDPKKGGGAILNANLVALGDIPEPALQAYRLFGDKPETCNVPWWLLAGIGRKETNHARFSWFPPDNMWYQKNMVLSPNGETILANDDGTPLVPTQYVRGIPLTGEMEGTARVLIGTVPDQANSMMQVLTNFFVQKTLDNVPDGNGDGIWNPYNLLDNVKAATLHLCERQNGLSGVDFSEQPDIIRSAVWSYNPSTEYVDSVIAYAYEYRDLAAMPVATSIPAATGNIVNVGGIEVDASIASPLKAMMDAAAADGVPLTGSGYRDPQEQIDLRKAYCGTTLYDIWEKPSGQCSPAVAIPGTSNHEKGLAIDFESSGWDWLAANAERFGFRALVGGEPWHYSQSGY